MARTTEHKEGKASVKVIYRTVKLLSDGSHPFWVRIIKDRKTKYIATGISLNSKYWNDKHTNFREAIRKSYPEPYREDLIRQLTDWEDKYKASATELVNADEVGYTAKDVAEQVAQKRATVRKVSLLAYIDEVCLAMKRAGQHGNADIYKELKAIVARFLKEEYSTADIAFDKVSVKFCNSLETHLRERGNSDNTIHQRFRVLRAIVNKAIAEEVTKPEHYPFARNAAEKHKFQLGKFNTKTSKRAISRDDVRKVESYQVPAIEPGLYASLRKTSEHLQLAKDVFLFSFYLGGINFVDLAALKWRNINKDISGNYRVDYVRQKTGGRFSVRLNAPTQAILDAYRPITENGSESYAFPILNNTRHTTPSQIKNRCHKVLGEVNTNLKTIAEAVGITVTLTTYVARHSFASAMKQAGIATSIISEAMGHTTEAVTQTYLTSFASETVDSAYDALL
ncbi:integrase [Fibrella aestuarina BUZ 2]|uniref:Integrase n=1 Tax=Fibrella aestuarina BUZ 2 TaxID=1166018 RepID=I0KB82_9BACT|nr:site-specific integrase [Fibrella aestuarina]CCH01385.1 integrase [Fibrella aestuarina BUZ 2]